MGLSDLRRRLERLESQLGLRRSNVVATWQDYGRARAQGWLSDATLTPAMSRAVRDLVEEKALAYIRSKQGPG
jgi:hypothetical protein